VLYAEHHRYKRTVPNHLGLVDYVFGQDTYRVTGAVMSVTIVGITQRDYDFCKTTF